MLRWRLFLGAFLIAGLAGLCWFDAHRAAEMPEGIWLFPLALLLSILATGEMLWMLRTRPDGPRPSDELPIAWFVYLGNLLIVASNGISAFLPQTGQSAIERLLLPLEVFVVVALTAFVVEIARYKEPGRAVARLALTVFCFVYVGVMLSFVVQLRLLWNGYHDLGMAALVSLIAVVKMGDTGAYTVGRLIGRHKMSPRISPAKTWEGAAGAMLFAALGSSLVFWLLPVVANHDFASAGAFLHWKWIAYGLIVGLAGLIGDLAESLIKRDTGHKDSSSWMPGFGGVLDLLDSILLAAPVAWFCWVARLVPFP